MASNLNTANITIILHDYCCIDKHDKWINVNSKSIKKIKQYQTISRVIIRDFGGGGGGVIGLFTADRLSIYRLVTEKNRCIIFFSYIFLYAFNTTFFLIVCFFLLYHDVIYSIH